MRTPNGDVARMQYEKNLTPVVRVLRKTTPFVFAAIPLVILRSYVHELRSPFTK